MLRLSGRGHFQLPATSSAAIQGARIRSTCQRATLTRTPAAPSNINAATWRRLPHAAATRCSLLAAAGFHTQSPVAQGVIPPAARVVSQAPPPAAPPTTPEPGRWLFLADVHFDHQRLEPLKETCRWVLEEVKRVRPRHIFFLGDTLHTRNEVHVQVLSAAATFLRDLLHIEYPAGESSPHVHLLVGNHDMHHLSTRSVTSLDAFAVQANTSLIVSSNPAAPPAAAGSAPLSSRPASRLPAGEVAPPDFVSSVLSTESLSRLHMYRELTLVTIDGQATLCVPYHHDGDVAQVEAYIDQMKAAGHDLSKIVCLAHLPLTGATISGIAQETTIGLKYDHASVPLKTLAQFKRCFLGHFHIHQLVGGSGKILYVGAPMQFNYGDANDDRKGFVLYEPSEAENPQQPWQLHKNPHAQRFHRRTLAIMQQELLAAAEESSLSPSLDGALPAPLYSDQYVEVVLPPEFDPIAQQRELDEVTRALHEQQGVRDIKVKQLKPPKTTAETITTTDSDGNSITTTLDGTPVPSPSSAAASDPLLGAIVNGDLRPIVDEFLAQDTTITPEERQMRREAMESVLTEVARQQAADAVERKQFRAQLRRLEVTNFLSVQGTMVFDFDALQPGVWYISGRNGSGKSLLLEALTWALFGKTLRGYEADRTTRAVTGLQLDELINDAVRRADPKATARVSVTFENGYTFTRTHTAGVAGSTIRVDTPGSSESLQPKSSKKRDEESVQSLLGLSFDRFVSSVLLSSTTKNFLVSRPEEKRRVIEDLLGFTQFEAVEQQVREMKDKMRDEGLELRLKLKNAQEKAEEGKKTVETLQHQWKQAGESMKKAQTELASLTAACAVKATELAASELQEKEATASKEVAAAALAQATKSLDEMRSGADHTRAVDLRLAKSKAEAELRAEVKKKLAGLQAAHQAIQMKMHAIAKQAEAARQQAEQARQHELTSIQRAIAVVTAWETARGQLDLALARQKAAALAVPVWIGTLTSVLRVLTEWVATFLPDSARERFNREVLAPLQSIIAGAQETAQSSAAKQKADRKVRELEADLQRMEQGRNIEQEKRDLPMLKEKLQTLLQPRTPPPQAQVDEQQAADPLVIERKQLEARMAELNAFDHSTRQAASLNDPDLLQRAAAGEKASEAQRVFDAAMQGKLDALSKLQAKRQECEKALATRTADETARRTRSRSIQTDQQRLQVQAARKEQEVESLTKLLGQVDLEVKNRQQQLTAVSASLVTLKGDFDASSSELSSITYWSDRLSDAQTRQKSGFRTFCIERVLGLLNPLVEANLDLFSMDDTGAVAHPLGARLTAELSLVAVPGATSMEKRSEGQRKRTHLALFLALFELSQRRSLFHNRFLFLDEAFDSLDQEGQQAVNVWIKRYANGMEDETPEQEPTAAGATPNDDDALVASSSASRSSVSRPHVFVITHSPYTSPSVSNGCIHVRLDPLTRASRYELDTHAAALMDTPFVQYRPAQLKPSEATAATVDSEIDREGDAPTPKTRKPRARKTKAVQTPEEE